MGNSDACLRGHFGHGRKYLNHGERTRFLTAAAQVGEPQRLFVETLAWTGARISEVLAISHRSFDLDAHTVTFQTLKRRRHVLREVPLPPLLLQRLDRHFEIGASQRDVGCVSELLWPFCRVTGWRIVKHVMREAKIIGIQASPRGLRHGFGVGTLQAGVPLTLLQRWLGHARLTTTAIYADVMGPEELEFASRFWNWGGGGDTGSRTAIVKPV